MLRGGGTITERPIPFQAEFEDRMISGQKTMTTRTERYGWPRDWFIAFGHLFVIDEVFQQRLNTVAKGYYEIEGFGSPKEFRTCWKKLHPRLGWDPTRQVFCHRFHRSPQGLEFHIHDGAPCSICGHNWILLEEKEAKGK